MLSTNTKQQVVNINCVLKLCNSLLHVYDSNLLTINYYSCDTYLCI